MFKIIHRSPYATVEAKSLEDALTKLGIEVVSEFNDGHKTIDLTIPKAKMDIEVDGVQHLTNPYQIMSDLNRGYYSHKLGYATMHIPNVMIRMYLRPIAMALAEAAKMRESKIWGGKIHVHVS